MKKYLIIPLVFLLSACSQLGTPRGVSSNFMRFSTDYVDPVTKSVKLIPKKREKLTTIKKEDLTSDDIVKIFLREADGQLSYMIQLYLKNTPQPFRAGFFDLSDKFNTKKYNDSNYFIKEDLLTTTYRPKTLYGSNFNTYIAYCPIFFEWDKRQKIVDYFDKFKITPYDNEKKYNVSFVNLTEYLVFNTFSHCALLNKAYKENIEIYSEKESKLLADMFAITIFVARDEENLAKFIIENNKQLHNDNSNNNQKLELYFKNIVKYFNANPSVNSNIYELWKITYDLKDM